MSNKQDPRQELRNQIYGTAFAVENHPKDFVLHINEKGVEELLNIFDRYADQRVAEARIEAAIMGAKFGNAAFRQQSIAAPGKALNLDTVREIGINQATDWAKRQ